MGEVSDYQFGNIFIIVSFNLLMTNHPSKRHGQSGDPFHGKITFGMFTQTFSRYHCTLVEKLSIIIYRLLMPNYINNC